MRRERLMSIAERAAMRIGPESVWLMQQKSEGTDTHSLIIACRLLGLGGRTAV